MSNPFRTTLSPSEYWSYALRSGLILGGYMSLQFLSILLFSWGSIATLLYLGMLVGVPLLFFHLAKRFRDQYALLPFTYVDALRWMLLLLLLAMIPLVLAYYIGFDLLIKDPLFAEMMQQYIQIASTQYAAGSPEQEALQAILQYEPREMALQFSITTFFLGNLFCYVSAFFLRKS